MVQYYMADTTNDLDFCVRSRIDRHRVTVRFRKVELGADGDIALTGVSRQNTLHRRVNAFSHESGMVRWVLS